MKKYAGPILFSVPYIFCSVTSVDINFDRPSIGYTTAGDSPDVLANKNAIKADTATLEKSVSQKPTAVAVEAQKKPQLMPSTENTDLEKQVKPITGWTIEESPKSTEDLAKADTTMLEKSFSQKPTEVAVEAQKKPQLMPSTENTDLEKQVKPITGWTIEESSKATEDSAGSDNGSMFGSQIKDLPDAAKSFPTEDPRAKGTSQKQSIQEGELSPSDNDLPDAAKSFSTEDPLAKGTPQKQSTKEGESSPSDSVNVLNQSNQEVSFKDKQYLEASKTSGFSKHLHCIDIEGKRQCLSPQEIETGCMYQKGKKFCPEAIQETIEKDTVKEPVQSEELFGHKDEQEEVPSDLQEAVEQEVIIPADYYAVGESEIQKTVYDSPTTITYGSSGTPAGTIEAPTVTIIYEKPPVKIEYFNCEGRALKIRKNKAISQGQPERVKKSRKIVSPKPAQVLNIWSEENELPEEEEHVNASKKSRKKQKKTAFNKALIL